MGQRAPVRFKLIAVDHIHADPHNRPDKSGDQDMEGLVRSVKALGILQPVIVVEMPRRAGHYELRAGERRWRAAQRAAVTEMLAIVRNPVIPIGRVDAVLVAIIENFQRVEHGPVELALMFGELLENGMTQADIARLTGLRDSTISYHCQLLKADTETLNRVRRGELPVGAVHEAVTAVAAAERTGGTVTQLRSRGASGRRSAPQKQRTHLDATHRLAADAHRRCHTAGHRGVLKIGRVACGECWEQAIRADVVNAGGRPLQAAEEKSA